MERTLRKTLLWNGWPMLAAAMAAFAFTCFIGALFNDGDTYWHLGAGQWIVDHWAIPQTDPFSFTARGRAWTAHEWLSELIMAGAFAAASWAGLSFLFAAAVSGTVLIVALYLRSFMRPVHVVAAVILTFIFLEPSLRARPHALAWPLLAGWTILLLRARKEHSTPPLAAAVLMLIWVNMHASFIFGLGLAAFFAFEALVEEEDRKRVLVAWGAFLLVSLLLALVNPSGLYGLLFPIQVSSMRALPMIQEWRPSTPSNDPIFFAVTALGVLLALAMRARPSLLRLLLIALLFYMALSHARHQAVFGIVALLLVASSLPAREIENGPRFSLPIALIAAVILMAIGALRYAVPAIHMEGPVYPSRALAALPPSLAKEPVFNSYNLGGVLIFKGIAPFIDGRADMYGDAFTADAYKIEQGDAQRFDAAVARWGIQWAILHPDEGLALVLDGNPHWRLLYADRYAVIFERR